ncbi:MAG: carboxypeptidase regulatory-like domain-containing protein, partial [Salinivirgaceae bacterium]|nr:carboxypeptidase regulatory-like domain-containing protein [Salinivirgaceae bacterium]
MKRVIYFILAIVLISIGTYCNKPDPKGNISGTVKNEVTNAAIDNAAIVLQLDGTSKGNTATDSKGEFVFNEIEPASYILKITANGYTENSASVSVKDGQTAPVSILLLPTTGGISGVVKDSETGNTIAGVLIKLNLGGNMLNDFTTSTDGKYSFEEIEPATYSVDASKEGEYEPNSKSVIVKSGEMAQGDINLTFIETGKPSLTTQTPTNITSASASVIGNITATGNAEITAYGHCWSLTPAPDITSIGIVNYGTTNATGEFTSTLASLNPETKYYIRAYATNSHGTGYSGEVSFTTLSDINVPTLTTNVISEITDVSAVCGGNISTNGGATITERGVCWSTTEEPTNTDSHTSDGIGTGSFTSNITGLMASTKYYVRAFATNDEGKTVYEKAVTINNSQLYKTQRKEVLSKSENKSPTLAAGTGYGNQVEFTTLVSINVPTVTTNQITAITDNSAFCGGNVVDDGGATVAARGVCWSEYENPTITDEHTSNGTGLGSYTSSLTELTPGKTYYVRAYATNSNGKTTYSKSTKAVGTGYGNQRNFTTQTVLPSLTTTEATSITDNSAISGGNISNDGGATVTARGVCYSTSPNPTITDAHTSDGTGTGSFTSPLSDLTFLTVYYVRAYATNSTGTAYGEQISFTTQAKLPTLTTAEV